MNKSNIRNIAAIVVGVLVGGMVNMALVMVSGKIIPTPSGVDVSSLEGLKAGIHLFEPKHFIMPFLAHALGTFVGAGLAALIAETKKLRWAILIGLVNLAGGISNIFMIPGPIWFDVVDVIFAYLPMAYLAAKLAIRKNTTH